MNYRPPGTTQRGGIRFPPRFRRKEEELDAVLAEMGKILG